MSREQITVSPTATGAELLELLRHRGVQRVAVVDEEGRLLGLITDGDLLTALSSRRGGFWNYLSRRQDMLRAAEAKTAAEIMKTDLISVTEDTSVGESIRLMSEHGLKRLPVVDEAGKFEGMVSRQALLAAGARCEG
jgi:CBS domain-containing protein